MSRRGCLRIRGAASAALPGRGTLMSSGAATGSARERDHRENRWNRPRGDVQRRRRCGRVRAEGSRQHRRPTTRPLGRRLEPAGELVAGDPAYDRWESAPVDTIPSLRRSPVTLGGRGYSPSEIAAVVLGKLKEDAECRLNEPVTGVALAVPAFQRPGSHGVHGSLGHRVLSRR